MSEIPYKAINLVGRLNEATKMVSSLFPEGNGFSKRYVIKALDLARDYVQGENQ